MPDNQALTLAVILTAGGATAAATLIAGLIALAKNLPGLGTWIDAKNEPLVAYVLAAVLVVLAAVDTHVSGLAGAFGAFLAWYGIATLSGGIHDQVAGATAP